MTRKATLIATLADRSQLEHLIEIARPADMLEVRADLVGDLDVDWLRGQFGGPLIYTLRSCAEGGGAEETGGSRRQRLVAAGKQFDLVDLEAERDLDSETLESLAPDHRLISWHGETESSESLRQRLQSMRSVPARWYKLVPLAERAGEEFGPLVMAASVRADDLIAFAAGEIGRWTRVLAPHVGAPVVYASLADVEAAPGQISLDRWLSDYGLPELSSVESLFGIVGHPVKHSLSPRLHNLGYRAHELPCVYVPFDAPSFADFWLEVGESGRLEFLGFPLSGLSVTAPHKETAAAIAGAISPLADRLDSVNTLVRRGEVWEGSTTDEEGVLVPLRSRGVPLRDVAAAVIGAGGAGRVACWALRQSGARVTLVNRDSERGSAVARNLGATFVGLSEFQPSGFRVIVHATPRGRDPEDPIPVDVAAMDPSAVLIDMVYRSNAATPLVQAARSAGIDAVDGREVLLAQAASQFRSMTGHELPVVRCREALGLDPPS